ncbi:peptidase domain-containing ABC transporter [Chryseolinea lacunae]|uniref:ATP-binding cassette domain-containing protein n=1 Tax=Chryseolinea lacunae TaxID=2801331 RepID=A0ABS1KKS1_9BACT|nr:cysteine peptidase family C39 domain-containing protein [Chryseolinea lacunae]MBL0739955.1 ATP-binding cassette domain-containing protein [Chryseolinea lacunae]
MKNFTSHFFLRKIKRAHVYQNDSKDCGPACLLALIRFYGGNSNLESIRTLCRNTDNGTSMLGMKVAAIALGMTAEGFEADAQSIESIEKQFILHIISQGFDHYVVCYGNLHGKYIISDPKDGIRFWSKNELAEKWKSGYCLIIEKSKGFIQNKADYRRKKAWIWVLIQDNVSILLSCTILGLVISALSILMSTFSQQLVDVIIPSGKLRVATMSVCLVSLLLIMKAAFQYIRQTFLIRQNLDLEKKLNSFFFKKFLHLPKSFFDRRKTGDLIARINDVGIIKNTFILLFGNLLIDTLVVLSSIVLIIYYNTFIGTICATVIPVYFIIIKNANRHLITTQESLMSSRAISESNYINTIQGIASIKSFNKQQLFEDTNTSLFGQYQKNVFSYLMLQNKLSLTIGITTIFITAIVLTLTIQSIFSKEMKIGEMTAVIGSLSSLLSSVANLALLSIPINEARIAFDRIYEYAHISPEQQLYPYVQITDEIVFKKLTVSNISIGFEEQKNILHDITFEIKRGELISIIGQSGTGKSLISQILLKFYTPSSGRMILNDSVPIENLNICRWRELIAVVPQYVHIFEGSLLYNICLSHDKADIDKALDILLNLGFHDYFIPFVNGYQTQLGEGGISPSGGQRQMIGLARALCFNPSLIVLDETTAHLDSETEKFVFKILEKLRHRLAVIFITHRGHNLKTDKIFKLQAGILIRL